MAKALPTAEYLRECFNYDPDTGVLTWKVRPLHHFKHAHAQAAWNARFADKQVGCNDTSNYGYLKTSIDNSQYDAHRLIWRMQTGDCPNMIDHKNGNGADNSWNNLREVTNSQNQWNRRHDRALPRGITLTAYNRYRVVVRVKSGAGSGNVRHVGNYMTLAEAQAAWNAFTSEQRKDFLRT